MADLRPIVRPSALEQLQAGDNLLADGLKSIGGAGVSLNSEKIINLADPTVAQNAATMAFVDSKSHKQAVRAATTANITLSATQTVDGVALAVGDRVLVKNQTTGSQNGIYLVASGAWTRTLDADVSADVKSAMIVPVGGEGTANKNTVWMLTTVDTITLGTTALVFVKITSSGVDLSFKAGAVAAGSFSGNPKIATVTFATPYADTNYAVSTVEVAASGSSHNISINTKLAGSFVINLGANNISGVTEVTWRTSKYGEQ